MNKVCKFIFFSFLLNNIALCQSIDFNVLPNDMNCNILLIGENHLNFEKDTIEFEIIKWYSMQTKKQITVFLERPRSLQVFIEKLFQYDDSLSLKQYFSYTHSKDDSTSDSRQYSLYNRILAIYALNKSSKNIKIKCVDRELVMKTMLYSIKEVLIKYRDSHKIKLLIKYIDSYLIKKTITIQDHDVVRRFFYHCLFFSYDESKIKFLDDDFRFLISMFENFKPMPTDSEIRENLLYLNIVNDYDTNSFHISINGIAHVNKFYSKDKKISGNRKSIGFMLNTYKSSPYKNKVSSLCIINFNLLTSRGLYNTKNRIHFMSSQEKKLLYSLFEKNNKYVVPDSSKFKYAHKAYDLLILVDTAHFYDFAR